jgi:hypothetical protein
MGLIYDNPDRGPDTDAARRRRIRRTRPPGEAHARYLGDLEQRNGTAYLELAAITLARVHFKSLDDLARATGADSTALLDAAEMDALEAL